VYLSGSYRSNANFGGGQVSSLWSRFYVVKFDATGAYQWLAQTVDSGGAGPTALRLDPNGNVLVTGRYFQADFGFGVIDSEGASDPFMVMYSSSGQLLWTKRFQQALFGPLGAAEFDTNGKIKMKGYYNGSMLLDNVLLVNSIPELDNHRDIFIGSFNAPCSTPSCDTVAPTIQNVPLPIVLQAENANGAVAKYTLPTATDDVFAGTTVTCLPLPGSTFAIGTTMVTCKATDAHGNTATATFPITVADHAAPAMVVPQNIEVTATGPTGANVTYTTPTANDQIAGPRPVTCAPASGSLFPIGTTAVTCNASDPSGNSVTGTFYVKVNPNPNAVFSWSGVLQPINADGSSIFKFKSTVAVKFKLTGASAGITNLVATISVGQLSGGVEGSVIETTSNAAPDNGNTFRYDATSDLYIYNLNTKPLAVGTWLVHINLGDGVDHTVQISLRP
jgi:hypothetical protein